MQQIYRWLWYFLNRSNFQLLNTIYWHLSMYFCHWWIRVCRMNFEKSIPKEASCILTAALMALLTWKMISSQFIIYWLDLYWSTDQNPLHFMGKQLFDHGFTFASLNQNLSCHIANILITIRFRRWGSRLPQILLWRRSTKPNSHLFYRKRIINKVYT